MSTAGAWAKFGGEANIRRLSASAYRVVEYQHRNSTRKLVDSDQEQALLEELIEKGKPPLPKDGTSRSLHFLLTTPFRYPPLRHGSRYGSRHERGIWYGSRTQYTAFAEVAYYRLLFLGGTEADIAPLSVELSCFQTKVRTSRGVDLTRPPFDSICTRLASRTNYEMTQRLGTDMRAADVEAFAFPSARDPKGGANIAVLSPRAFVEKKPSAFEAWRCIVTHDFVELSSQDFFRRKALRFERSTFLVRGELPRPAV